MKPGLVLFDVQLEGEPRVRLESIAYDGPRGNRVRLTITDAPLQPGLSAELLEGPARQLHLALRAWVRRQKALRGDTPRGRAKLAAAKEGNDAAATR